jgi:CheY-like chemotaxis protein
VERPAPRARADRVSAPLPATCRVLLVDDNRDAAESLALLLQYEGHDVRTAYDGEAALAVAEEFRPQVALLDLGLPKLNGFEVAQRLRRLPGGADMTLVALTGWDQVEYRRRGEAAGFTHHFAKPVDIDALRRVLAERVPCAS